MPLRVRMHLICDCQNKPHLNWQTYILNNVKIWECPMGLTCLRLCREGEGVSRQAAWTSFCCRFAFFWDSGFGFALETTNQPTLFDKQSYALFSFTENISAY